MSPLEHRLRRWLRLYPVDQREEMLGVLLATAGPGQERPGPRDAVDLLKGAGRIRLRREIRSLGGPVWRDAFAVLSLVPTLLLLTGIVDFLRDYNGDYSAVQLPPAPVWPMWAPWILIVPLSLCGLRRTAAGLAWVATSTQPAWLAASAGSRAFEPSSFPESWFWLSLAVIAAAALSVSGGLRRALPLLGAWRVLSLLIGVGGFAYVVTGIGQQHPHEGVMIMDVTKPTYVDSRWLLTLAPSVLIIVSVARLRTAYGRRAAALLVLSLAPLLCALAMWQPLPGALASGVMIFRLVGPLAVVALIGAAATFRLRERRRSTS